MISTQERTRGRASGVEAEFRRRNVNVRSLPCEPSSVNAERACYFSISVEEEGSLSAVDALFDVFDRRNEAQNITGTWCHPYDDSQLELSKPARRTACEYVGLMNERNQILEAKFLPAGVRCRLGVGEQVRFDEVRSLAGGKEKKRDGQSGTTCAGAAWWSSGH